MLWIGWIDDWFICARVQWANNFIRILSRSFYLEDILQLERQKSKDQVNVALPNVYAIESDIYFKKMPKDTNHVLNCQYSHTFLALISSLFSIFFCISFMQNERNNNINARTDNQVWFIFSFFTHLVLYCLFSISAWCAQINEMKIVLCKLCKQKHAQKIEEKQIKKRVVENRQKIADIAYEYGYLEEFSEWIDVAHSIFHIRHFSNNFSVYTYISNSNSR